MLVFGSKWAAGVAERGGLGGSGLLVCNRQRSTMVPATGPGGGEGDARGGKRGGGEGRGDKHHPPVISSDPPPA